MSWLELIERLHGKRVVVLGDLVADEYVYGMTSRVSREAPVLVVRYTEHEYRLGGAANAANNVTDLSGVAIPIGVLGKDEAGRRVSELFERFKMPRRSVVASDRPTTVKTRIMAGSVHTTKQQILRLDREDNHPLPAAVEDQIVARLEREMPRAHALLVSDYGLGVLSPRVIQAVRKLAKAGKIVCVDSRYNLLAFRGVTAVTPNEPEAEAAAMTPILNDARVKVAGQRLLRELSSSAVLITRGRRGMALFEAGKKPAFVPISGADEVADVTGAGDTVIATFTLALAAGADFLSAARLANHAAGVSVMKAGAATVTPEELWRAVSA